MCECVHDREIERIRERQKKEEEARKPVKLRQQGPACKKVKEGVYCNVTQ